MGSIGARQRGRRRGPRAGTIRVPAARRCGGGFEHRVDILRSLEGVFQTDVDRGADHVSTGRGLRAWIVSGPAVERDAGGFGDLFKHVPFDK